MNDGVIVGFSLLGIAVVIVTVFCCLAIAVVCCSGRFLHSLTRHDIPHFQKDKRGFPNLSGNIRVGRRFESC